jgi:hypothetical protein
MSMRKAAIFVAVCTGGPLLALVVGTPVGSAAPNDPHGATVSINGETKHTGTGLAFTDQSTGNAPNVAVALNGGPATAIGGSGNRAVSINAGEAVALGGNDNHATAINGASSALAVWGNNNRAIAINDSQAQAGGTGIISNPPLPGSTFANNDSAIAVNGAKASAVGADNQTVICHGGSCRTR